MIGEKSTTSTTSTDTSTDSPSPEDSTPSEPEPEPEPEPESEPETASEPSDAKDGADSAETDTSDEAATDTGTDVDEDSDEEPESSPIEELAEQLDVRIQADVLDEFLSIGTQLLDEAVIEITEDGFEYAKQDAANVALSNPTLNTSAFNSYQAATFELGMNIESLKSKVNLFDDDDEISLSLSEKGRLQCQGNSLTFDIAPINPDSIEPSPELPEFANHTEVTVETDFIKRGIKAADMVSEYVTLETTDDALVMKADGDTDTVSLETDSDEIEDTPDKCASVILSLDYLKDIKKALPGDTVTLELDDDQPIIINGDLDVGDGTYMHMLAPRIQAD